MNNEFYYPYANKFEFVVRKNHVNFIIFLFCFVFFFGIFFTIECIRLMFVKIFSAFRIVGFRRVNYKSVILNIYSNGIAINIMYRLVFIVYFLILMCLVLINY